MEARYEKREGRRVSRGEERVSRGGECRGEREGKDVEKEMSPTNLLDGIG